MELIQKRSVKLWALFITSLIHFTPLSADAVPVRLDNYNTNTRGNGNSGMADMFFIEKNLCFVTVSHVLSKEALNALNKIGVVVNDYPSINTNSNDNLVSFCVSFDQGVSVDNIKQVLQTFYGLTKIRVVPLQTLNNANTQIPTYSYPLNDGQEVQPSDFSAIYPNGQLVKGRFLFQGKPGRSGGILNFKGKRIGQINGSGTLKTHYGLAQVVYFTTVYESNLGQRSRTDAIAYDPSTGQSYYLQNVPFKK